MELNYYNFMDPRPRESTVSEPRSMETVLLLLQKQIVINRSNKRTRSTHNLDQEDELNDLRALLEQNVEYCYE